MTVAMSRVAEKVAISFVISFYQKKETAMKYICIKQTGYTVFNQPWSLKLCAHMPMYNIISPFRL